MPALMRRPVRDALGDAVCESLAEWVESPLEEKGVTRDEYREILSRLDVLNRDVAYLKREIGALHDDITPLHNHADERFDRLNGRFDTLYDRMLIQTRWRVGAIAMFGTLITLLLAVSHFRL